MIFKNGGGEMAKKNHNLKNQLGNNQESIAQ
jgi:hypothetical protein